MLPFRHLINIRAIVLITILGISTIAQSAPLSGPAPQQISDCLGNGIYGYVNETQIGKRTNYVHLELNNLDLQECIRQCYGNHFCYSLLYDESIANKCVFYYHAAYNCSASALAPTRDLKYVGNAITLDCIKCPANGDIMTTTPVSIAGNINVELPQSVDKHAGTHSEANKSAKDSTEKKSGDVFSSTINSEECSSGSFEFVPNYEDVGDDELELFSDSKNDVPSPKDCIMECHNKLCDYAYYIPSSRMCYFSPNTLGFDSNCTMRQKGHFKTGIDSDNTLPVQLECIRCNENKIELNKSDHKDGEWNSMTVNAGDAVTWPTNLELSGHCLIAFQVDVRPEAAQGLTFVQQIPVQTVEECGALCYKSSCTRAVYEHHAYGNATCKLSDSKQDNCADGLQQHYKFWTTETITLQCLRCLAAKPTTRSHSASYFPTTSIPTTTTSATTVVSSIENEYGSSETKVLKTQPTQGKHDEDKGKEVNDEDKSGEKDGHTTAGPPSSAPVDEKEVSPVGSSHLSTDKPKPNQATTSKSGESTTAKPSETTEAGSTKPSEVTKVSEPTTVIPSVENKAAEATTLKPASESATVKPETKSPESTTVNPSDQNKPSEPTSIKPETKSSESNTVKPSDQNKTSEPTSAAPQTESSQLSTSKPSEETTAKSIETTSKPSEGSSISTEGNAATESGSSLKPIQSTEANIVNESGTTLKPIQSNNANSSPLFESTTSPTSASSSSEETSLEKTTKVPFLLTGTLNDTLFMQGCIVTFQMKQFNPKEDTEESAFEYKTNATTAAICATKCFNNGCTGAFYDTENHQCILQLGAAIPCTNTPIMINYFPEKPEKIRLFCLTCTTDLARFEPKNSKETTVGKVQIQETTTIKSAVTTSAESNLFTSTPDFDHIGESSGETDLKNEKISSTTSRPQVASTESSGKGEGSTIPPQVTTELVSELTTVESSGEGEVKSTTAPTTETPESSGDGAIKSTQAPVSETTVASEKSTQLPGSESTVASEKSTQLPGSESTVASEKSTQSPVVTENIATTELIEEKSSQSPTTIQSESSGLETTSAIPSGDQKTESPKIEESVHSTNGASESTTTAPVDQTSESASSTTTEPLVTPPATEKPSIPELEEEKSTIGPVESSGAEMSTAAPIVSDHAQTTISSEPSLAVTTEATKEEIKTTLSEAASGKVTVNPNESSGDLSHSTVHAEPSLETTTLHSTSESFTQSSIEASSSGPGEVKGESVTPINGETRSAATTSETPNGSTIGSESSGDEATTLAPKSEPEKVASTVSESSGAEISTQAPKSETTSGVDESSGSEVSTQSPKSETEGSPTIESSGVETATPIITESSGIEKTTVSSKPEVEGSSTITSESSGGGLSTLTPGVESSGVEVSTLSPKSESEGPSTIAIESSGAEVSTLAPKSESEGPSTIAIESSGAEVSTLAPRTATDGSEQTTIEASGVESTSTTLATIVSTESESSGMTSGDLKEITNGQSTPISEQTSTVSSIESSGAGTTVLSTEKSSGIESTTFNSIPELGEVGLEISKNTGKNETAVTDNKAESSTIPSLEVTTIAGDKEITQSSVSKSDEGLVRSTALPIIDEEKKIENLFPEENLATIKGDYTTTPSSVTVAAEKATTEPESSFDLITTSPPQTQTVNLENIEIPNETDIVTESSSIASTTVPKNEVSEGSGDSDLKTTSKLVEASTLLPEIESSGDKELVITSLPHEVTTILPEAGKTENPLASESNTTSSVTESSTGLPEAESSGVSEPKTTPTLVETTTALSEDQKATSVTGQEMTTSLPEIEKTESSGDSESKTTLQQIESTSLGHEVTTALADIEKTEGPVVSQSKTTNFGNEQTTALPEVEKTESSGISESKTTSSTNEQTTALPESGKSESTGAGESATTSTVIEETTVLPEIEKTGSPRVTESKTTSLGNEQTTALPETESSGASDSNLNKQTTALPEVESSGASDSNSTPSVFETTTSADLEKATVKPLSKESTVAPEIIESSGDQKSTSFSPQTTSSPAETAVVTDSNKSTSLPESEKEEGSGEGKITDNLQHTTIVPETEKPTLENKSVTEQSPGNAEPKTTAATDSSTEGLSKVTSNLPESEKVEGSGVTEPSIVSDGLTKTTIAPELVAATTISVKGVPTVEATSTNGPSSTAAHIIPENEGSGEDVSTTELPHNESTVVPETPKIESSGQEEKTTIAPVEGSGQESKSTSPSIGITAQTTLEAELSTLSSVLSTAAPKEGQIEGSGDGESKTTKEKVVSTESSILNTSVSPESEKVEGSGSEIVSTTSKPDEKILVGDKEANRPTDGIVELTTVSGLNVEATTLSQKLTTQDVEDLFPVGLEISRNKNINKGTPTTVSQDLEGSGIDKNTTPTAALITAATIQPIEENAKQTTTANLEIEETSGDHEVTTASPTSSVNPEIKESSGDSEATTLASVTSSQQASTGNPELKESSGDHEATTFTEQSSTGKPQAKESSGDHEATTLAATEQSSTSVPEIKESSGDHEATTLVVTEQSSTGKPESKESSGDHEATTLAATEQSSTSVPEIKESSGDLKLTTLPSIPVTTSIPSTEESLVITSLPEIKESSGNIELTTLAPNAGESIINTGKPEIAESSGDAQSSTLSPLSSTTEPTLVITSLPEIKESSGGGETTTLSSVSVTTTESSLIISSDMPSKGPIESGGSTPSTLGQETTSNIVQSTESPVLLSKPLTDLKGESSGTSESTTSASETMEGSGETERTSPTATEEVKTSVENAEQTTINPKTGEESKSTAEAVSEISTKGPEAVKDDGSKATTIGGTTLEETEMHSKTASPKSTIHPESEAIESSGETDLQSTSVPIELATKSAQDVTTATPSELGTQLPENESTSVLTELVTKPAKNESTAFPESEKVENSEPTTNVPSQLSTKPAHTESEKIEGSGATELTTNVPSELSSKSVQGENNESSGTAESTTNVPSDLSTKAETEKIESSGETGLTAHVPSESSTSSPVTEKIEGSQGTELTSNVPSELSTSLPVTEKIETSGTHESTTTQSIHGESTALPSTEKIEGSGGIELSTIASISESTALPVTEKIEGSGGVELSTIASISESTALPVTEKIEGSGDIELSTIASSKSDLEKEEPSSTTVSAENTISPITVGDAKSVLQSSTTSTPKNNTSEEFISDGKGELPEMGLEISKNHGLFNQVDIKKVTTTALPEISLSKDETTVGVQIDNQSSSSTVSPTSESPSQTTQSKSEGSSINPLESSTSLPESTTVSSESMIAGSTNIPQSASTQLKVLESSTNHPTTGKSKLFESLTNFSGSETSKLGEVTTNGPESSTKLSAEDTFKSTSSESNENVLRTTTASEFLFPDDDTIEKIHADSNKSTQSSDLSSIATTPSSIEEQTKKFETLPSTVITPNEGSEFRSTSSPPDSSTSAPVQGSESSSISTPAQGSESGSTSTPSETSVVSSTSTSAQGSESSSTSAPPQVPTTTSFESSGISSTNAPQTTTLPQSTVEKENTSNTTPNPTATSSETEQTTIGTEHASSTGPEIESNAKSSTGNGSPASTISPEVNTEENTSDIFHSTVKTMFSINEESSTQNPTQQSPLPSTSIPKDDFLFTVVPFKSLENKKQNSFEMTTKEIESTTAIGATTKSELEGKIEVTTNIPSDLNKDEATTLKSVETTVNPQVGQTTSNKLEAEQTTSNKLEAELTTSNKLEVEQTTIGSSVSGKVENETTTPSDNKNTTKSSEQIETTTIGGNGQSAPNNSSEESKTTEKSSEEMETTTGKPSDGLLSSTIGLATTQQPEIVSTIDFASVPLTIGEEGFEEDEKTTTPPSATTQTSIETTVASVEASANHSTIKIAESEDDSEEKSTTSSNESTTAASSTTESSENTTNIPESESNESLGKKSQTTEKSTGPAFVIETTTETIKQNKTSSIPEKSEEEIDSGLIMFNNTISSTTHKTPEEETLVSGKPIGSLESSNQNKSEAILPTTNIPNEEGSSTSSSHLENSPSQPINKNTSEQERGTISLETTTIVSLEQSTVQSETSSIVSSEHTTTIKTEVTTVVPNENTAAFVVELDTTVNPTTIESLESSTTMPQNKTRENAFNNDDTNKSTGGLDEKLQTTTESSETTVDGQSLGIKLTTGGLSEKLETTTENSGTSVTSNIAETTTLGSKLVTIGSTNAGVEVTTMESKLVTIGSETAANENTGSPVQVTTIETTATPITGETVVEANPKGFEDQTTTVKIETEVKLNATEESSNAQSTNSVQSSTVPSTDEQHIIPVVIGNVHNAHIKDTTLEPSNNLTTISGEHLESTTLASESSSSASPPVTDASQKTTRLAGESEKSENGEINVTTSNPISVTPQNADISSTTSNVIAQESENTSNGQIIVTSTASSTQLNITTAEPNAEINVTTTGPNAEIDVTTTGPNAEMNVTTMSPLTEHQSSTASSVLVPEIEHMENATKLGSDNVEHPISTSAPDTKELERTTFQSTTIAPPKSTELPVASGSSTSILPVVREETSTTTPNTHGDEPLMTNDPESLVTQKVDTLEGDEVHTDFNYTTQASPTDTNLNTSSSIDGVGEINQVGDKNFAFNLPKTVGSVSPTPTTTKKVPEEDESNETSGEHGSLENSEEHTGLESSLVADEVHINLTTTTEPPVAAIADLVHTLSRTNDLEYLLRGASKQLVDARLEARCGHNTLYFTARPMKDFSKQYEVIESVQNLYACLEACYVAGCAKAAFAPYPQPKCLMHFGLGSKLTHSCSSASLYQLTSQWHFSNPSEVLEITCLRCSNGDEKAKETLQIENVLNLLDDSKFKGIQQQSMMSEVCKGAGRLEFQVKSVSTYPRLNITHDVPAMSPADCAIKCAESKHCDLAGFVPSPHKKSAGLCLLTSDVHTCDFEDNERKLVPQHHSEVPFLIHCIRCSKCRYNLESVIPGISDVIPYEITKAVETVGECADECGKIKCTVAQFDPKASICSMTIQKSFKRVCPIEKAVQVDGNLQVRIHCVSCSN